MLPLWGRVTRFSGPPSKINKQLNKNIISQSECGETWLNVAFHHYASRFVVVCVTRHRILDTTSNYSLFYIFEIELKINFMHWLKTLSTVFFATPSVETLADAGGCVRGNDTAPVRRVPTTRELCEGSYSHFVSMTSATPTSQTNTGDASYFSK